MIESKQSRENDRRLMLLRSLDERVRVSPRGFFKLSTDPCQEGECQHHEGDVTIPADPTADLIMIEVRVIQNTGIPQYTTLSSR